MISLKVPHIDGIDGRSMIRKGHLSEENIPAAYKQVYGFSRITVSADKCSFIPYEYLARQYQCKGVTLKLQ